MEELKKIKFIVIHHSNREVDSLERIKDLHVRINGWNDIGYHYLISNGKITEDGKVYPGRSERVVGAHVFGHNKNSISICLIGNLDKNPPTKKQLQSLIKFLKQKTRKYNILVKNILGHNEFKGVAKSCPGKFLDVNEIRKEILRLNPKS